MAGRHRAPSGRRSLIGLFWATLTGCPCRHMPYLDHHTRSLHVRNTLP